MNSSTDHHPDNPTTSPFRSLRRWAGLTLGLVLALVALRVWWGWAVNRRIAREVADAQARGEPIRPEDFDPVRVTSNQNAVPVYERAMAAVRLTPAQRQALNDFNSDAPLAPQARADFESALKANAGALRLAREARARPLASWDDQQLRPPTLDTVRQDIGDELALLLWADIEAAAASGDFREAAAGWRDLTHLAASLRQSNTVWDVNRVSRVAASWVCGAVERRADELEIGGPRGADPADLRAVIADLTGDAAWRDAHARAWWAGRMAVLNAIPRETDLWPAEWRPLVVAVRPMLEMERLRQARDLGDAAGALMRAPDAPTLRTALPVRPADLHDARSRLDRVAHSHTDHGLSDPPEFLTRTYFRALGERHLAAVTLAACLYRADHGGAWPETADALVPSYLPAVPRDPFAANGAGIKLVAAPDGRHVVYSVGENGTDEGGLVRRWPSGAAGRAQRWEAIDAGYFLERPGPGASTRKAEHHESDVRGGERDADQQ